MLNEKNSYKFILVDYYKPLQYGNNKTQSFVFYFTMMKEKLITI